MSTAAPPDTPEDTLAQQACRVLLSDHPHRRTFHLDEIRGTMIRFRREDLGLSQGDLAAAVGTSQQAISRVELGAHAPSDEQRVAIAKALRMRTSELFFYADDADAQW